MTTPITFPIPARFGGGDLVMRTLTFDEAEAAVLRAEVPGMREALATGGLAAVVATFGIRRELVCDAIVTLRGEAAPADPDERKAWWHALSLPEVTLFGGTFDRLHFPSAEPVRPNIDPSGSAGE